jgi:ParB family chromosome partitioning protein
MLLTRKKGLFEGGRVLWIKTTQIVPNPNQPRRIFDAAGLRELAESIRLYGVLQPLTVRRQGGGYELVAGERRLRASRLAGMNEVPCLVVGADERESSLLALVENLQRSDLDYIEEAEGLQRLIKEHKLSQEEAARRVGKSQSAVANKLRLLKHPPDIIVSLRQNGLTERHARALLRIEDENERRAVLETIVADRLNVAQTDEHIETILNSVGATLPEPEGPAPMPAVKETRTQGRVLYIVKDVRLFLNTIQRAVDTMRRSGVEARYAREDTQDGLTVTIHIPVKKQS